MGNKIRNDFLITKLIIIANLIKILLLLLLKTSLN